MDDENLRRQVAQAVSTHVPDEVAVTIREGSHDDLMRLARELPDTYFEPRSANLLIELLATALDRGLSELERNEVENELVQLARFVENYTPLG